MNSIFKVKSYELAAVLFLALMGYLIFEGAIGLLNILFNW